MSREVYVLAWGDLNRPQYSVVSVFARAEDADSMRVQIAGQELYGSVTTCEWKVFCVPVIGGVVEIP